MNEFKQRFSENLEVQKQAKKDILVGFSMALLFG